MSGEVFIGNGYHNGIKGVGLEKALSASLDIGGVISGDELTRDQVSHLLELRRNGTKLTDV
ncbi:MAG: hypothetical protein PHI37_02905 [Candidatus Gracilibacteria bacterium]|nr:hypothetical protein [Candidatus Gracilibacteria bacterium]